MSTENPSPEHPWILQSCINSFHYLYNDAEWLRSFATDPIMESRYEQKRLLRTAVILYALSLEALINRAFDAFLEGEIGDFFCKSEDKFSTQDKWFLLPLLVGADHSFDKSQYPWSHFAELVKARNDYVHPKHDRPGYYRLMSNEEMEPLRPGDISAELSLPETRLVYRQMRIPRDPYALLPEHLERVKKVVDNMIDELDVLLEGRVKADDWLHKDDMEAIHPPGATFHRRP